MKRTLSIADLEESPRVQTRRKLDPGVVTEYKEAYESGAIFPPIVVFNEKGTERYVIADGHHRYHAMLRAEIDEVEADVRDGDDRAALELAFQANTKHGLRLKPSDRRFAFRQLMASPELCRKYPTHQDKAELLGVSLRTIQSETASWREERGAPEDRRQFNLKKNARKRAQKPKRKQGVTQKAAKCAVNAQAPDKKRKSDIQWTSEDERTYQDLREAWEAATPAAQAFFQSEL